MNTMSPPMNPEVARLRRQGAQRRYLKGLRYVRGLWAVAGLLLILLVVEVLVALSFSPRFWITRIQVSGIETLTAGEVIQLANVPEGSNFYRTSLRDIATRVCANQCVERVSVRRQSVGTLEIIVHERQAVCQIGNVQPLTYLDASGHLFTRPKPPVFAVPVVDHISIPPGSQFGQRVHSGDAQIVLECLAAAQNTPAGETLPDITRVVVEPKGRLTLVLRSNTKVYLGQPGDFARKMWVMRHTIVEAAKEGFSLNQLDYIDVKVITRQTGIGAYFKPRDQQGTQTP